MAKNCPRPECVDGCTRVAWECFSATPMEETVAPEQNAHVRLYQLQLGRSLHTRPPIPEGMTDWRKAAREEVMDDIARSLRLLGPSVGV